jgi:hypothetical protein
MASIANSLLPFVGCRSFYESEQSSFYGRMKQVDDVLLLLHKHKFIAFLVFYIHQYFHDKLFV